jgi:hypothetical protein
MGNISLILLWITLFIILGLFIFYGVKNIESVKANKDAYILGEFLPDSMGIFKRSKQSKYEKFPSYIAYLKEMENTYFNNK